MSVEFLVTSFIVIVSPGTGVLYTLAAGLARGSRASVVAAFGCMIGIVHRCGHPLRHVKINWSRYHDAKTEPIHRRA